MDLEELWADDDLSMRVLRSSCGPETTTYKVLTHTKWEGTAPIDVPTLEFKKIVRNACKEISKSQ